MDTLKVEMMNDVEKYKYVEDSYELKIKNVFIYGLKEMPISVSPLYTSGS